MGRKARDSHDVPARNSWKYSRAYEVRGQPAESELPAQHRGDLVELRAMCSASRWAKIVPIAAAAIAGSLPHFGQDARWSRTAAQVGQVRW